MLGGNDDVTGDDLESLDAEDFLMEEADPKQNLPTDRQVPQPQPRPLVQQPETASVNKSTDPSAAQRQLVPQPQFPADAQTQGSAEGQDWQLVAARWWRQQRQQIQP